MLQETSYSFSNSLTSALKSGNKISFSSEAFRAQYYILRSSDIIHSAKFAKKRGRGSPVRTHFLVFFLEVNFSKSTLSSLSAQRKKRGVGDTILHSTKRRKKMKKQEVGVAAGSIPYQKIKYAGLEAPFCMINTAEKNYFSASNEFFQLPLFFQV